jgi:uncharacterized protein YerC
MYHNIIEVMTSREIEEISARFEIRDMLRRGKTYREIAAALKVSPQTISKVKKLEERGRE